MNYYKNSGICAGNIVHRFYVPSEQISNGTATIAGSDVNHIKNVLRMKAQDKIEIFDGRGNSYIAALKPSLLEAKIVSKLTNDSELKVNITLAQCLPKAKKMDFIVQKAVELGVNSIIPVISERSVPKIEDKADKKISHWQKIAKEAAEQSGRLKVPEIMPLLSFGDLLKQEYELKLMPWEGEKETTLKGIVCPTGILVLIGPEGGFSVNEVNNAVKNGFRTISLGKRILRTETAGIVILSQLLYELDS